MKEAWKIIKKCIAFAIALGILVNFSKIVTVFSKDSEQEKIELHNMIQQVQNKGCDQEAVDAYIDKLTGDGEKLKEASKEYNDSLEENEDDIENSENTATDDMLMAYKMVRVVDGDTIIVSDGTEDIRVRLIGVNCPESDTKEGKAATAFTEKMLSEKTVYLQCDSDNMYDKYDRLLAYVWLDDNVDVNNTDDMVDYMYNCILLTAGYADVMIVDNDRYKDVFTVLEQVRNSSLH